MHDKLAAAERGAQDDLSTQIEAALALSRATLHALAALSNVAQTAAEAALESEADRASDAVRDIVEDARAQLQRAPAEAEMAQAMRLALVAAAEALPSAARRVA